MTLVVGIRERDASDGREKEILENREQPYARVASKQSNPEECEDSCLDASGARAASKRREKLDAPPW